MDNIGEKQAPNNQEGPCSTNQHGKRHRKVEGKNKFAPIIKRCIVAPTSAEKGKEM